MDKIQVNKVSLTKALSLVVLVVFVSCTKNEPDNGGSDATQNLDEFTTYTVDINSKPISFFDLIEEVELVRLEETPESLLSWVSQLRFTDDLVIFPGNKGDVFTFKNDGTFINKFNSRGPGPEEYSSIGAFWVDEVINIYDVQVKRIQRYSLSGEYLESQSLLYNVDFLYPMTNGGYVLDRNLRRKDSLNFDLVLLDDKFKKVVAINPFQFEEDRSSIFTYDNSLRPYKGGVVYQKNMTDTVFFVNQGSLQPLLTYDFGRDWVWNIDEIASNPLARREATMSGTHVWRTSSMISPDYVFMNFKGGSESFKYVFIDRAVGEPKVVDLRRSAEKSYALSPILWDDDRLIFSLRSTDLEEFLGDLKDVSTTFRKGTTLDEMESSENPVLVWVKFK